MKYLRIINRVDACFSDPEVKKPAVIGIGNRLYLTCPIERFFVSGKWFYIETENSVYTNMGDDMKNELGNAARKANKYSWGKKPKIEEEKEDAENGEEEGN